MFRRGPLKYLWAPIGSARAGRAPEFDSIDTSKPLAGRSLLQELKGFAFDRVGGFEGQRTLPALLQRSPNGR